MSEQDEPKRYGMTQDEYTGALILWETADALPFTHIAQVFNEEAWNRYLSQLTAEVRREAAAEALDQFADTLGVSVDEDDSDEARGYRNGQRQALHAAIRRATAIREQGTE